MNCFKGKSRKPEEETGKKRCISIVPTKDLYEEDGDALTFFNTNRTKAAVLWGHCHGYIGLQQNMLGLAYAEQVVVYVVVTAFSS